VVGDLLLPNKKVENGFCREGSEIDTWKGCGCFGGGVYYFAIGNSPVTGDPDGGRGMGDGLKE